MPLDLFDVRCAGRCREDALHSRLEVLRPALPEAWRVVCLRCNTERLLWLAHACVPTNNAVARCGQVLAPPLRVSQAASGVSCPVCRVTFLRELAIPYRLDDFKERCLACRQACRHSQSLWLDADSREAIYRTCSGCSLRSLMMRPVHLEQEVKPKVEPSSELTFCGMPRDRAVRKLSDRPRAANCPRCLEVALANAGETLRPDWRPVAAMPEDYYGI